MWPLQEIMGTRQRDPPASRNPEGSTSGRPTAPPWLAAATARARTGTIRGQVIHSQPASRTWPTVLACIYRETGAGDRTRQAVPPSRKSKVTTFNVPTPAVDLALNCANS
jgi:hypothetical protein